MVIGIEPADGGTAIDRYRALSGRWHHVVDATGIGKPDLEGCVVQPANGSPYDVQVSAHNAQGWGAWSELRTGTPIPIPSRTFPGAGGRCVAGLGHGRSPVSGHSGKLQSCNIDPDVGHTNSDTGRGCCRPAPRPAAHSSSSNLNAVMRMSSTAKSLAAVVVPQAPARFRAACPAATPASRTSYARFPLSRFRGAISLHRAVLHIAPHGVGWLGILGDLELQGNHAAGGRQVTWCGVHQCASVWTATGWEPSPVRAQSGAFASFPAAACTAEGDVSTRSSDSSRPQGSRGRRE